MFGTILGLWKRGSSGGGDNGSNSGDVGSSGGGSGAEYVVGCARVGVGKVSRVNREDATSLVLSPSKYM